MLQIQKDEDRCCDVNKEKCCCCALTIGVKFIPVWFFFETLWFLYFFDSYDILPIFFGANILTKSMLAIIGVWATCCTGTLTARRTWLVALIIEIIFTLLITVIRYTLLITGVDTTYDFICEDPSLDMEY